MKKTIAMLLVLVLSLTMVSAMADSLTIGISQFAEHGSLDNCRNGFLQGLADAGYVEGDNLTVLYQNAQTDGGTAAQIAQSFIAQGADMICAIATPSAQTAYNAVLASGKDIPVIYTAISAPVEAGLAYDDGTPVGNITGTSDLLPTGKQLEMIRALLPDAKTIGIIYSSSEVNSAVQAAKYEEVAADYGFTIICSTVTSGAEVSQATSALLPQVDCISMVLDNTVVSYLAVVLDAAQKAGKPVFGSEIEQVAIGCVAAQGIDYIALGKKTGEMAAQVLSGESAENIPYASIEDSDLYLNTEVIKDLGLTIPESLTAIGYTDVSAK